MEPFSDHKLRKAVLSGKLIFMLSDDMFEQGLYQIHSAKTGQYLGTWRPGQAIPDDLPEAEQVPQVEIRKPVNQLELF